jgi:hypothetical protein
LRETIAIDFILNISSGCKRQSRRSPAGQGEIERGPNMSMMFPVFHPLFCHHITIYIYPDKTDRPFTVVQYAPERINSR